MVGAGAGVLKEDEVPLYVGNLSGHTLLSRQETETSLADTQVKGRTATLSGDLDAFYPIGPFSMHLIWITRAACLLM